MANKKCEVIQNGVNIPLINRLIDSSIKRDLILSIRGVTPLYRIEEILVARANSTSKQPIKFIFPLWDEEYQARVTYQASSTDEFLGRVDRDDMFRLLNRTKLAISIPESDSSPRTVYEAIFCGCCVAVTYNNWIDALPECMKLRLYIVDLQNDNWFDEALSFADKISTTTYKPSQKAVDTYDQFKSVQILVDRLY